MQPMISRGDEKEEKKEAKKDVFDETKRKLQIILLGEVATGKTSLLNRYCNNKFTEGTAASLGIDFAYKKYHTKTNGEECNI